MRVPAVKYYCDIFNLLSSASPAVKLSYRLIIKDKKASGAAQLKFHQYFSNSSSNQ